MSQAPSGIAASTQARRWTITVFPENDDLPEDTELDNYPRPQFGPDCRYSVCQLEVAPSTGRLHLQVRAML